VEKAWQLAQFSHRGIVSHHLQKHNASAQQQRQTAFEPQDRSQKNTQLCWFKPAKIGHHGNSESP
jgi:hypothetical protein